MLKLNLSLPQNLECTLKVAKSKKSKFSSIVYNKRIVRKIDNSLIPSEYNDGDKISIILQEGAIAEKDTLQQICAIDKQALENNVIIDLVRNGDIVEVFFDDIKLDEKDVNYFGDLFTRTFNYNCQRRNSYKAFVNGENSVSLIRYVNTHQHTEYSRLDGMTKLKDIAKKTEWAGAITDHGVMTGVLKFDSLMRGEGKKPILGFEGYIEEIDENLFNDIYTEVTDEYKKSHYKKEHIILLAKNNIGYKNLLKLASLSWNNFYGKNHIVYSDLKDYSEGIIATSACLGSTLGKTLLEDEKSIKNAFFEELGNKLAADIQFNIEDGFDLLNEDDLRLTESEKKLLEEKYSYTSDYLTKDDIEKLINNSFTKTLEEISKYGTRAKLYISKMIEIFGRDDFYIEIQRHKFFSEEYIEKVLLAYAKEFNLKIVTGIDNHYLNEEDAPIHEMWLCESTKKNLNDPGRLKFPGEGYWLMTSEEVYERFKDIPEAMENSLEIADKCDVDVTPKGYSLPSFPLPEGYGEGEEELKRYFKFKVNEGYRNRFAGTDKCFDQVYVDRMKFEMATIAHMGFESYFLIVQDYISWAKDTKVAENIERYFPSKYYDLENIPEAIKNKTDEIYVGPGRGSAAGSLVAYCLGITNINPIEYGLLFERGLKCVRKIG